MIYHFCSFFFSFFFNLHCYAYTYIQEQGYTVVHRIILCNYTSVYHIIYISFTIAFKLIIHMIGLILAFMTRKVNIDPLNDSRYSPALIYISCVLLIIAIILSLFVENENTRVGAWTTFVFLDICVFLGLNFIPKVN